VCARLVAEPAEDCDDVWDDPVLDGWIVRCDEAFGGSSKIWQPNAVMPRSVRASLITPPMRVVISSIVLRT